MGAGCGWRRTNLAAPYFSSPCPARIETLRRFTGLESLVKTSFQKLFINRLAKVTDNSVIQRLLPICIIGVGCHEDCRNLAIGIDKLSVELDAGHHGHVDVGNQAVRFGKTRGCQKIASRWKRLDTVAHRSHEPFHGLAKELIVFHDGNQSLFHYAALWPFARR